MTSTHSADASALPSTIPGLRSAMPRRGFLAGLTKLPLIGGSVALLGQPSAVAEPVTPDLIEAYKTWLALEHRSLTFKMAEDPHFLRSYSACFPADADRAARSRVIGRYELFIGESAKCHTDAYDRAALVLSTVGCDWRDHEDILGRRRA